MPPLLLVPRPAESKFGCMNRSSDMSSGKWKSVSSTELAQSIDGGGAGNSAEILIVDCRSLVAFNGLHIRGAIHVNCTGIGRKRLSQGKAKLKDLISSAEGKEKFIRGGVGTTFVIYDELSSDPEDCNPCRPICLVLQNLLKEGRNISVLKGGLKEFCRDYQNLCENAPVNHCDLADFPPSPTTCDSCPGRPQGTPVTAILPFLYLGNEEGAADEALIDRLSIKYILNLTPRCPNFFSHRSDLNYRQIKVNDSNQEDIAQHFDEAIQFIDEARGRGSGILVHCHAGVSRSATVTVAYIMKQQGLCLGDAYKFVKELRPVISPNLNFMGQLLKYEKKKRNDESS